MSKIERYTLVEAVEGAPLNVPPPGQLLLSREYSQVLYQCPCGCGATVQLLITFDWVAQKSERVWRFKHDGEVPSLNPSIQAIYGCRSHYHIDKGVVVWA